MQYYAHISDDKVRRQTVKEHLTGTARRSELFAEAFRCGAWGYGCGILHDIGKYSQGFRKRLEGGSITDHATPEEEKEQQILSFDADGIAKGVDWLNEQFEGQKARWKVASRS